MTDTQLFNFDRQQFLKEWQPMPNLLLHPDTIEYYEQKIRYLDEEDTTTLMSLENDNQIVDNNFIKYVALKRMNNILRYIESKGVVLNDVIRNIRQILDEILNGEVNEDYYLNTIDIYESLCGLFKDDIYGLINQAIRLDNKRMLYYLIFYEDCNINCMIEDYTVE